MHSSLLPDLYCQILSLLGLKRGVGGQVINKRRAEKPEVRKASREAALREVCFHTSYHAGQSRPQQVGRRGPGVKALSALHQGAASLHENVTKATLVEAK